MSDAVAVGGRPGYTRFDAVHIFFWPEAGADYRAGWRVSQDHRSQTSAYRQRDLGNALCPGNVSTWEYYDGDGWRAATDFRLTCAAPLPPNATCTDSTPDAEANTMLAIWGSLTALGLSIGLYLRCGSYSGPSGIRYERAAGSAPDHPCGRYHLDAWHLAMGLALATASLASFAVGWLGGQGRNPKAPPMGNMWVAVTTVFLSMLSLWVLANHDATFQRVRRLQTRAWSIYTSACMLLCFVACLVGLLITDDREARETNVLLAILTAVIAFVAVKLAHDYRTNLLRLSSLTELDGRLKGALASGSIRLIDADALRSGRLTRVERRQALEARQAAGEQLLLSAETAVQLVCEGKRQIGFLTYGWRTPDHPDPDNATLETVARALRSAHGQHIRGLFWDMGCLWQSPRTALQNEQFKQGLQVMADGYSSPLAVTVLRRRQIPASSAALSGRVVIFNVPASVSEAAVRASLEGHHAHGLSADGARKLVELSYEPGRPPPDAAPGAPAPDGRWLGRFGTHSEATEAVAELSGGGAHAAPPQAGAPKLDAIALWYNERPYESRGNQRDQRTVAPERDLLCTHRAARPCCPFMLEVPRVALFSICREAGWCCFESAVSTEALVRIEGHPRLKARLASLALPPKLLEIDYELPEPAPLELPEGGVAERIQALREAISRAAFTGKADRPQVLEMLDGYIDRIATAMYKAGVRLRIEA